MMANRQVSDNHPRDGERLGEKNAQGQLATSAPVSGLYDGFMMV
jgi:hypothetical protein